MASEPPFGEASIPFGAHQPSFRQPTEVGSGTASYFGGFGGGQESPTGNPFAFAIPSLPPGQGFQQNFPSPPKQTPTSVPSNMTAPQHHPAAAAQVNVDKPHNRHIAGAPNTAFNNQQENQTDESLYRLPRSKSSQAHANDSSNVNAQVPCSGSSSAPVTGLVGTVNQYPEGHPSLEKLMSLPTSSSGSSIERPPLSPVLSLPSNSLTNASLPGSQYIPYVQSYPHLPTNATNAAEDFNPFQASSVSQVNTNAETQLPAEPSDDAGITMKDTPDSPPEPGGLTNAQPHSRDNTELSATENEYLSQGKDGRHMRGVGLVEGDQSLASSLNQSMSSLLDSQEDIAQQSPVKILLPAPEAKPLPPPPSTTPQPSQQFPPPRHGGHLAQDQVRQAEETKIEPAPTQTSAAAASAQGFLPPLHNSSLPAMSLPSQTVSVSQPPPLHTSPYLTPSGHPTHPPHHQLYTTSEAPPHGEVPRKEEIPGATPYPPQVSSAPQGTVLVSPFSLQPQVPATTMPASNMPMPPPQPHPSQSQPLLQTPHVNPASQTMLMSPLQPPSQPSPTSQPQSLLQPSVASSVLPPRPQSMLNTAVVPRAVLLSAQTGLLPTQVSSVLPPPSNIHAPPVAHLPLAQERTNADVQPSSHDWASVSVQPPPNLQLQQPTGSLQPKPFDSRRDPADRVYGESGPLPNVDSSNVQTVQPPLLFLPPVAHDPLSNAPSNAMLLQSQLSIPSNAHSLSQQPPLQSIPSNAHQPLSGVLSNAHPPQTDAVGSVQGITPIVHQQAPGGAINTHGVLSNANFTQFMPRSLVTGVQLPPPTISHASSDNVGTQPQHLFSTANTTGTMAPPLSNNPPHPQSVPLHQLPTNNNIASTPDSVFSPPTLEAPLAASNVATGFSTVVSAHPANPHSTGLTSARFSAVPPKVHLTQTQATFKTQPNSGPVTVSTSQAQIPPSFAPPTGNYQPLGAPSITTPGLVQTLATNIGKFEIPSMPPQPVPSFVGKTEDRQPSVSSQVAPSSTVPVSGPPHPTVTAPTAPHEQRAPVVDHHRLAGGRPHPHGSASHQHPLSSLPPSSSHQQSHRGAAEHPMPHPHHNVYGGDGRPWRHSTDLRQQRERYDPYYGEDPYEYERHGHYYEDPYYGDYYRPRPGSRAPHMYYPDQYEHDPYGSYYTEYDPYTGKYYYVEDAYSGYPGEYDYYGHPREGVPDHARHTEQGDPHMHTREHTQTQPISHETGGPYADQSTIDGPGEVFEEGGTFFDSPDTRGAHRPQHRSPYHPEGSSMHHLYPNPSQYGPEPPLQPDWGPSEPPVASEPLEPPIAIRKTPEKFACPHVRASFAPGGTLVVVLPHNLRAFQRAEVELSHVTELVSDSVHANFVRAVSEFPGPLIPGETPKSVAISYASRQAEQCRAKKQAGEENEEDEAVLKELNDESLLWEFLVLLCQQNGVVVASDISELLTREKATVIPSRTHVGAGDQEDALENIRQLLISGRKRDALELACSRCLWGHALMLASKMDEQSRTYVINRFTASLVTTDPLSTFYTLMLGRTPSAVKPEGLRRAGSWRPHLAMILANRTNKLDNTSIMTLGDSLLESGHLCGAHFCYHLADIPFGVYGSTTSKYLLLGTPNSELAMGAFPRPEHLRKMEVFEYAMSLGKVEYVLPHFQVFKFLLALQLTQFGMVAKAFKYCEQIAAFIGKSPGKFSPTLLHVLDELSTQLHHLNHPHGVVETELPSWLLQLQETSSDIMVGNYTSSARSTPSPTFSSVSQAYGQGRRNSLMGTARNQFLKVPGNSYKAGSVDSSTATSSKEGSLVGGTLPLMQSAAQQGTYQPSNLVLSQQQGLEPVQPPQDEGGVQAEEVPYSQSNQLEETVPVSSGADGIITVAQPYYTTQDQVPYGGMYAATTDPTTSEGDYGVSQAPPASEQHSTFAGEFGVTSAAVGDVQPQPVASYEQPMYGQTLEVQQPPQWQQYPAMEGQGHQGGQEQPVQFGYGQPATDPSQGGMLQPNLQQPPSQPEYGANVWDQQYTGQAPGETVFSSSGDLNTPAVAGDTDREEREVREEEEKKEDTESKKNEDKPGAEQGTSGGILSFFMKPFRKTGPPRAKLPSDKEPRIVWDKEKGKWVDLDAGDEDEQELVPPPTDSKLSSVRQLQRGQGTESTDGTGPPGPPGPAEAPQPTGQPPLAAPPAVSNAYSRQALGRRGVRSKYVDVMNPAGKSVGGASTQAPPPSMAPPPMMSGSAPPSFFVPQQPPTTSEGGEVVPVTNTQTTATGTSTLPVASSQSDPHTNQHPSHGTEVMGVPPSTAVESRPKMPTAPPPAHDHHHHRDDHRHHRAPNVPPPVSNEPSQPPPPTQQAMPHFFNPSAFAPVSSMTGPRPDPMDDTQSTVSEMSQEVSRINSHQPAPRAPVMGTYNRLRHGRRVAYPQQELSGPPPRHK